MDFFGIGNILRVFMERAGWPIALIVLVLLIVSALLWKLFQFGVQMGQQWLEVQRQEKDALMRQLETQSQRLNTILSNHMAHLQQSQETFSKFQADVSSFQGKTIEAMHNISERIQDGFKSGAAADQSELDEIREIKASLLKLEGWIQGRGE